MKEKKFIFVYITTNLINGKQYVGDHSTNSLNEGYIGTGTLIIKAIKKYGKENFKREILEFCNTRYEAFKAQEKYIIKYKTLVPNGYNISPTGGLNEFGRHSEKTKKKISKVTSGKNNGMFGKKHSEETKKKWSEKRKGPGSSMYGKKGENCPNFGKKHSEETKKKWSIQRKGKLTGEKNGMYGKSNYSIWIEKYGAEIANQKRIERSIKASKSLKGKKLSDTLKKKLSEIAKNRKKIQCVYCNRFIDPLNFKKYHGEKCKLKV